MGKPVATQFFPEGPSDPAQVEIVHMDGGERSALQIQKLLDIRVEASRFLFTKEEVGSTFNVDEEARTDARAVYVSAGYQLRNILDDMPRWSMNPGLIEQNALELLAIKKTTIAEREDHDRRPSVAYRPRIAQMPMLIEGAKWVVWLGADEPQKNGPYGFGNTPEEAMRSFDLMWTSGMFPSMPSAPAPKTPPPEIPKPEESKPASEKKPKNKK